MRSFFQQFSIYSIGVAVSRLASLLLLPLYTRFLSTADYGVLDTLMTLTALCQPFLLLGIDTAIQILFFKTKNRQQQNDLVMTSIITVALVAGSFALISIFLSGWVVQLLFGQTRFVNELRWLCVDMMVNSLLTLFNGNLRLNQQAIRFNIVALIQLVLMTAFNVWFIVIQKMGISGFIAGLVLADTATMLFAAFTPLRQHLQRPSFMLLANLLRVGLPLVPVSAAYWVLSSSDRFFLVKLSTLNEVGIYGIANRLATGIGIFTFAVQLGWRPFAMRIQGQPQARQIYATMPIYYFAGVGWIGLAVATGAPILLAIFTTASYASAVTLLTPLILTQVIYGAYYLFSTGLEIKQQTYHVTWTIGLAAVINTILNVLLIPKYGALGAALATVIAYGVATLCVALLSQRAYPLPYERRRFSIVVFSLLVGYTVVAILFLHQQPDAMLWGVGCTMICGIVFIYLLRQEVRFLLQRLSFSVQKVHFG